MTRATTAAAVGAVGLVAAAGVVAVLGGADLVPASTTRIVATTPAPEPKTAALQTTPSPSLTTATAVARGPLISVDAQAALPRPGEVFAPAELEVELGSVCEGATLDLLGATPAYASLQSVEAPLRYLDVVVVVYDTVPLASVAYDRVATAITQCPLTRTATPTPTAPDETPSPIEVTGEVRPDLVVGGQSAMQWVQVQSADGTELRTAITVVLVENALVAVSLDESVDSTGADTLAGASLAQAEAIVVALNAASS
jgi:hypothetical protein